MTVRSGRCFNSSVHVRGQLPVSIHPQGQAPAQPSVNGQAKSDWREAGDVLVSA